MGKYIINHKLGIIVNCHHVTNFEINPSNHGNIGNRLFDILDEENPGNVRVGHLLCVIDAWLTTDKCVDVYAGKLDECQDKLMVLIGFLNSGNPDNNLILDVGTEEEDL